MERPVIILNLCNDSWFFFVKSTVYSAWDSGCYTITISTQLDIGSFILFPEMKGQSNT